MDERWRHMVDQTQQKAGLAVATEIFASLFVGSDKDKENAEREIKKLREESALPLGGWASEILAKIDGLKDQLGLE